MFNQQISKNWELLVEVMYELSEKRSREINEQDDGKKKCFLIKK